MNITSKIVALSSAVAFALQIALALLMLRYFSPAEVGTFSVISQIGFFWTTLALAQSPLRLLANQGVSVFDDARQAWITSFQRFVCLLPIVSMVVWFSGLTFVSTMLWALLMSFFQFTWMLAQSMRFRMAGAWLQSAVRVIPPLMALLVAFVAASMQWNGPALLVAGLIGYASGAFWLIPALSSSLYIFSVNSSNQNAFALTSPIPLNTNDDRSVALRISHSLADAVLATAIVVVWQRLYGPHETGYMSAPMRVMGFIPAATHMAWTQVQLAHTQEGKLYPLWVGLAGFAMLVLLGLLCAFSLEIGLLGSQWQGVMPYLIALTVWQGGSCINASFIHRFFLNKRASLYSYRCILLVIFQLTILTFPMILKINIDAHIHFYILSIMSFIGLLLIIKNSAFILPQK